MASATVPSARSRDGLVGEGFDDGDEEFGTFFGGAEGIEEGYDDEAALDIDFDEDMLRYGSVKDVSTLFRSNALADVFKRIADYNQADALLKNAITKDDPEYSFMSRASEMAISIELEKTKVHKFLRDHYAVRFPELASLIVDSYTYAKIVNLISNNMDLRDVLDDLDELVPSQTSAAIISCACTTQGRALEEGELLAVKEAADELIGLEDAKQILLEYIQTRMPLITPNLSAFLGTAITSQLFALAGSVTKLATMDSQELAKLGSNRRNFGGFKASSAGFLINADLVACHPPELRARALRMVSQTVSNMARIDDSRRASDNSQGLRAREDVKRKMLQWTDPMIKHKAHDTYERRIRKRRRFDEEPTGAQPGRERRLLGRFGRKF